MPFADTPEPPYYAVIFSAQRTRADPAGYEATTERMVELAQQQPGYLGHESARDEDGFGITVSYWNSEADIRAWKEEAEHREAQQEGRARWYQGYEIRVAKVERAYNFRG